MDITTVTEAIMTETQRAMVAIGRELRTSRHIGPSLTVSSDCCAGRELTIHSTAYHLAIQDLTKWGGEIGIGVTKFEWR